MLQALINYLAILLTDGDWMNDWLTHLPGWLANVMEILGYALTHLMKG